MKRIGTFAGHLLCIEKARFLYDSLCQNTDMMGQYGFTVMTPEHLNLTIEIPGIEQINFKLPEAYRPIPFVDKMVAAAEFESRCDDIQVKLTNMRATAGGALVVGVRISFLVLVARFSLSCRFMIRQVIETRESVINNAMTWCYLIYIIRTIQ